MKRLILAATVLLGLAGCGMNPGLVPDAAPVKGKVTTADGKPVRDVILTLQPMESAGHAAGMKVGSDGTFRGEVVPGKYSFFFSPQEGKAAALRAVPEKYRSAHMDHTLVVRSGENLEIRLN